MAVDPLAVGVRDAAFGEPVDAQPTALPEDQSPNAKRRTPTTERCPACGTPRPRAALVHKGVRLNCCAACYWARRHAARVRWEQTNRARRTRQRHKGGVPCPPYVAWTVETFGLGAYVLYRQAAWPEAWPEATVMPAYGACSCGAGGCVHLVVACLAQQGGGESDG